MGIFKLLQNTVCYNDKCKNKTKQQQNKLIKMWRAQLLPYHRRHTNNKCPKWKHSTSMILEKCKNYELCVVSMQGNCSILNANGL